jgi:heme/copper-type cytochrome/quinol oxidase subunit 1
MPVVAALNLFSSVSAFLLAGSILIFFWNMAHSLVKGQVAGDNPWDAWTLEWATTSPPAPENFDRLPPVYSRRPLYDLTHPAEQPVGDMEGKAP